MTTSLKTYQHFTLEKAYLGEDFFWAFTPVAGDFIRIRFFTPVRIERWVPQKDRLVVLKPRDDAGCNPDDIWYCMV